MRLDLSTFALAVVAVTCAMAVACAQSGATPGLANRVSAEEALWPSMSSFYANQSLVDEETQRCMLREGLEYIPVEYPVVAEEVSFRPNIGNWTVELAGINGFGIVSDDSEGFFEHPNADRLRALSAEEQMIWRQAHERCASEADETINGSFVRAAEPIRRDFADLVAEFESDSLVVNLQQEWAACMIEDGYTSAASFDDVVSDFVQREFDLKTASPRPASFQSDLDALIREEQRVAVAAARCGEPLRADYEERWKTYEADFASKYEFPTYPQP